MPTSTTDRTTVRVRASVVSRWMNFLSTFRPSAGSSSRRASEEWPVPKSSIAIRQPALRSFVMIPLLLNIVVFAGLGFFAIDGFAIWLDRLMLGIPDWAAFVRYLLWPLFVLLLLVISAWTFTILGNLIAAPFGCSPQSIAYGSRLDSA